MPSFSDSIFIFFIALLIFGPKKLPELARQLGKLMAEFRRASNEFRMQMEDELRIAEQAEQQKKIAAMEAAAPAATVGEAENTIAPPPEETAREEEPIERHPHDQHQEAFEQQPIATSGDLNLMPPATGLPVASSSVSHAFDAIPRVPDPEITDPEMTEPETIISHNTTSAATEAAPAEPATEALHG